MPVSSSLYAHNQQMTYTWTAGRLLIKKIDMQFESSRKRLTHRERDWVVEKEIESSRKRLKHRERDRVIERGMDTPRGLFDNNFMKNNDICYWPSFKSIVSMDETRAMPGIDKSCEKTNNEKSHGNK